MSARANLILNSSKRCYFWVDPEVSTLTHLANDRFSPISALVFLLGTTWAGDRISMISDLHDLTDLTETTRNELWGVDSRSLPLRPIPRLRDATQEIAAAREAALTALERGAHEDRRPMTIVNTDLHQYIDAAEFGDGASLARMATGAYSGTPGGIQTAMTFLLAASSRGRVSRGDLPSRDPLVGAWSGSRLAAIPVYSLGEHLFARSITQDLREALAASHMAAYRLDASGKVVRDLADPKTRDRYLRRFKPASRHRVTARAPRERFGVAAVLAR